MWAQHRPQQRTEQVPLSACVVKVTAPELTGDQLVGVVEMADIAGVAASTLRAYISRSEGDVPQPQAAVNGRHVWSRPVAEEWAERRRHSPENAAAAVSTNRIAATDVPTGIADVWERLTRAFYAQLWENPSRRKLWALRSRTPATVHDVAQDLAWSAAASITSIVPIYELAVTIEHAVLGDLAESQRRIRDDPDEVSYFVMPNIIKMLDWLIRHHPRAATAVLGEILGEAERQLSIPRRAVEDTLHNALSLDGKLPGKALDLFLDSAFSPASAQPVA